MLHLIAIAGIVISFDVDEGPGKNTEEILNILKEQRVKAIFCLVAGHLNSKTRVRIAKKIVKEGHLICNHGTTHRPPRRLSYWRQRWEIRTAQKIFKKVLGIIPKYYRPPSCQTTCVQLKYIKANNIRLLNCKLNSGDWKKRIRKRRIYKNILRMLKVNKTGVLLLHDNTRTLKILKKILKTIKTRRYLKLGPDSCINFGKVLELRIRW
ncbi:MAG TPA: polysaccharide deacetylase family protein [bacterium]|nr:polysaccharide deacetylase family protein [bacterium]